ncbi:MAG: hypothetical protein R2940_04455 [Syntrophotaleaceae bacterium]
MLKRLLLLCLICSPAAAWSLYKPMRVIAPQWVEGISCVDAFICIDDVSRYPEALELYKSALHFVSTTVGSFHENPRVTFCTTEVCFQSFGFTKASASTVGKSGIVVSPRGWTLYYLRHEMIHHLQAERLGVLTQLLGPVWFIEGMAYSLSDDPRQPMAEPWRQHRADFEAWYEKVGKEGLWDEARKL